MEEKELFEEYEVRNWEITPRIYKIFGTATIINFLILFAFGQFNLLSAKGCDTPYFGIVCQALDSAYIATTLLGEDKSWESRVYTKSEIGDAEEITFIDVSDRLEYPEGYFALANPEQMNENSEIGVIPSSSDSGNPLAFPPPTAEDPGAKPAVTPTPNKEVANQEMPDELFKMGDDTAKPQKNPSVGRDKPIKPGKTLPNDSPKTLNGNDVAKKPTPKPTPSVTPSDKDVATAKDEFNQKFNKKPLQDFADGVLARLDSPKPEDKVDLKQSFTVILDGTLTTNGTFDAEKTRFVKGEGNEQMVNLAKDAIEAMGDSTIFSYLMTLGVDKVNITLVQDDKQISAIIRSNQPTPERAKTISSGFNGLIAVANMNTKDDKDVQALLKATKFTAEGKSFVINFTMPKEDAHKMIDQKLQEARQKKSQPNSGEGDQKESAAAKE
jgi:hypothetical protein